MVRKVKAKIKLKIIVGHVKQGNTGFYLSNEKSAF